MTYAADDMMLEVVCVEAYGGREHWSTGVTSNDTALVDLAPETLAGYVGTYRGLYLSNTITIEITMDEGQLFLQRGNGQPAPLLAQSQTAFVQRGGGYGYVFTVEEDGTASAISEVHVSGAWSFDRVP